MSTHCAYNVVGLPINAMDNVELTIVTDNWEWGQENEFDFTADPLHIRKLKFVSSKQCNRDGCEDNTNKTKLVKVSDNQIKLFIIHQKTGSDVKYVFEFIAEAKENIRLLTENNGSNLRRLAWVNGTIYATLTFDDELTGEKNGDDETETTHSKQGEGETLGPVRKGEGEGSPVRKGEEEGE